MDDLLDGDWDVNPEALAALTEQYGDQQHPLFMTDSSAIDDNVALQALHEIYKEGDKTEVALNCKEQGNDALKAGRAKDAVTFYSHGIDVEPEDEKLLSAFLSLGDNVRCVDDCRRAVKVNSKNIKAFQRAAMASMRLSLFEQALNFAEAGLVVAEDDALLAKLKSQATEQKTELAARKAEARAEEERQLKECLRVRGLTVQDADSKYKEAASNLPAVRVVDGGLVWPLLFVFDDVPMIEAVAGFSEQDTLRTHLAELLKDAPWDEKKAFSADKATCFIESGNLRVPVPLDAPLGVILEALGNVTAFIVCHVKCD